MLNAAGIVRQDEQQVGLDSGLDSEHTLAVHPVDFDLLLVRKGESRPVDDDCVDHLQQFGHRTASV